MKKSLKVEFGAEKPRAIVLDDDPENREMTRRALTKREFDVIEADSAAEFFDKWQPGMADVVLADWHLSTKKSERGDAVLEKIRERDWEVPFVLVSGRLDELDDRVQILESLLKRGNARFIVRGNRGIEATCNAAEELIERRDMALLRIILGLRRAALANASISTSSGNRRVAKMLEEVVKRPESSREAERPVAVSRSRSYVRKKK